MLWTMKSANCLYIVE